MATTGRLVVRTGIYPHQVEKVLEYERQQLRKIGADLRLVPCRTEDELIAAARSADGVLHAGPARFTRRVLEALERCRVIVSCSVGVDLIDVAVATERGIVVANLPDICINEVADQTMALILACNRKIVRLNNRVKSGLWDRALLEPMPRLQGLTIGLLAFGRIARAVARRAQAFGLHVLAYDPFVDDAVFEEYGVERSGLDGLLRRSDFVSSHLPLTESTRGLLGERELRLMKPSAFFINTSRGGVVDETALVRALQEGWIAGAALDVLAEEPPQPHNPLLTMENVIITPHSAGYSDAVVEEMRLKAVAEVIRVLEGFAPRPIAFVNPEVRARLSLRDGEPGTLLTYL